MPDCDTYTVAWVASIPGVGPRRFVSLKQRFSDLSELLTSTEQSMIKKGVPEKLAHSILSHRENHTPEEIKSFCQQNAVTVIPYDQVNEENVTSTGSSQKSDQFVRKIPAYAGMTGKGAGMTGKWAGMTGKGAGMTVEGRPPHTPDGISKYVGRDMRYPPLLSCISDPPVVLYLQGELPDANLPAMGVVGTRNVTSYGRKVTTELTTQLAHAGVVIVSGFMYGVDAIAHSACIEAGGLTVAVLGYGLGVPFFPRQHDKLAREILAGHGCLLTEFPPWQTAVPGNFPSRNRIVSGLSLGVLVTEAAQKSGSRITAQCAVDQGREVFAVPGPMHSPYSEGTKELVNLGAKLVTSVEDILEELKIQTTGQRAPSFAPDFAMATTGKQGYGRAMQATGGNFNRAHCANELEEKIYTYIQENTQAGLEELLIHTQAEARTLATALSTLELSGYISQDGSGVFSVSK